MTKNKSINNCQANIPSRIDIITAMSNDVCFKADVLKGGSVTRKGPRVIHYSGGYTNVFPFIKKDGRKVAIRCWCADINNAQERCQRISEALKGDKSGYFVDFQFVHDAILINGTTHPIIVMEWVEGDTLKEYVECKGPSKQLFLDLAEKFRKMVEHLHKKKFSHGDLQHGNIMIRPDNSLCLIDYDSMYVDKLNGFTDVIKGLPGYQHPARAKNKLLTPKADYFSELVIYLSLNLFADHPDLWNKYAETEDLLFSLQDFTNIQDSELFKNYSNTQNPLTNKLMLELKNALTKDDINELLPLEDLLKDSAVKLKPPFSSPATSTINTPDIDGILSKINKIMQESKSKTIPSTLNIDEILSKIDKIKQESKSKAIHQALDIDEIINKIS